MSYCPNCGAEANGTRYCTSCGATMSNETARDSADSPTEVVDSYPITPSTQVSGSTGRNWTAIILAGTLGVLLIGGGLLYVTTSRSSTPSAPSAGTTASPTPAQKPAPTPTVTVTAPPVPLPTTTVTVAAPPAPAGPGATNDWPAYAYAGADSLCTTPSYPLGSQLLRDPTSYTTTALSIQYALAALNYSDVPFNGEYGPRTSSAVYRFQGNHDLVADGLVGPQTWSKLRDQLYYYGKC